MELELGLGLGVYMYMNDEGEGGRGLLPVTVRLLEDCVIRVFAIYMYLYQASLREEEKSCWFASLIHGTPPANK